ncbi:MAG: helix-turn-helix transcriptional regulator [Pseudomonadota bacterium]
MPGAAGQQFQSLCREWRQFRKLSQLELALNANVSQRHVSWLETGRSKPSREMVLQLSQAMDIPLRERNVLFRAAGFAPVYNESDLDDPAMAPVLDALRLVLRHHDPLPAVVVDRLWGVRMTNEAAELLLGVSGDPEATRAAFSVDGHLNLALLCVHPDGLRKHIANWDQVAPSFVNRLKCEAAVSGSQQVQEHFADFIKLAGPMPETESVGSGLLPVLPLELKIGSLELSLFSVIATFGTPQDITTDELRIESFYPTDTATKTFFEAHAGKV